MDAAVLLRAEHDGGRGVRLHEPVGELEQCVGRRPLRLHDDHLDVAGLVPPLLDDLGRRAAAASALRLLARALELAAQLLGLVRPRVAGARRPRPT